MASGKTKIADLLIKIFPHDNEEDYDITFEIANKAFAPFHQVDYLLNGIFKDVGLMNEINSNGLKDNIEIQNRKNRIYTNGKIIHPIYKIKKSNNEESDETGSRDDYDDDSDDYPDDSDDYPDDSDDYPGDSDVDDESDDVKGQQNRKRPMYSSRRGGKNKKQHRKTKKHSKK
jgi:hypothetical protein